MPEPLAGVTAAQRTAARLAGLAYLIPMALVVYAFFGLRQPLSVPGDLATTVRNIAAAETRYRLSAVLDLGYCIGIIVLIGALYVVLASVQQQLALLATLLRSAQAFTATLTVLSGFTIVRLASNGDYAHGLGSEAIQALVRLETVAGMDQYYVGLVFWALASTLIGWLWLKSRYIPAALAGFGVAASAWAALCALIYLTAPGFRQVVNWWWFDTPLGLFDITLGVWLLLKGLRDPARAVAAA